MTIREYIAATRPEMLQAWDGSAFKLEDNDGPKTKLWDMDDVCPESCCINVDLYNKSGSYASFLILRTPR